MTPEAIDAVADALLAANAAGSQLAPITDWLPEFDVASAYAVLHEIERRRAASGWRPVGRKIGFTNRTIWPRYNVFLPMWAHVWEETVTQAPDGRATVSLARSAEPRIEPEVVFGLAGPVTTREDAREVLAAVAWIAPGFEIVQSHFPGWRFKAPDCTAAFGLHRALVVGRARRSPRPVAIGLPKCCHASSSRCATANASSTVASAPTCSTVPRWRSRTLRACSPRSPKRHRCAPASSSPRAP